MLDRVKHGKTSGRMPGFSLIELIAVIMIIAIISAAIFVGSGTASMKARAAKVTSDLYNYQIAAEKILYNQPQVRNIATGTKKNAACERCRASEQQFAARIYAFGRRRSFLRKHFADIEYR